MSYMEKIEKLLLESAKQNTELGKTLVSIYTIANENEDESISKIMMEAFNKYKEFNRTMINIIDYLKKRMDME